ncbi:MAG: DEAD/DEAH box helicase [Bacteroidota bacterium]|nr:DEAD/DEAH box helicase [Bacteroidota bacterium]
MSFSHLGLSEPLLKELVKQKYTLAYPVQQGVIPAILNNRDILAIAKTGSGKTLSFVLPILQKLQGTHKAKSRHIKVLVLVPTRELSVQVAEVFQLFGMNLPQRVKSMAVYGGVSINPQMIQLQGIDVLIATPGRLLDLMDSNAVQISEIEILVLDEADKMLNLGFKEEMGKIFARINPNCQHLLFSATFNQEISSITELLLKDPVRIEPDSEKENINENLELITQIAYLVKEERKGPLLRYLIKKEEMKPVLIFASSIHKVDSTVSKLNINGIQALPLHSKLSMGARTEALQLFKNGKLRVLVATDLASRGIDIPFLPFVINYELPRSPKDYIHRIGRTGRADSPGTAISLISPDEEHHFHVILKKMGKLMEAIPTDGFDLKGY